MTATSRNNATEKDARHWGGACSAVASTNLRSQKKTKDGGKL